MHMLHLLRHAKSSWKEDVEDHQRRLNKRGRNTALVIGQHLPRAIGILDLALCSTAARARETLDLALAGYRPPPPCVFDDALYLADCAKLFDRLCLLSEDLVNVLVLGHNPGLHEFSLALADPHSPEFCALAEEKFPTLARASFRIATPWAALGDTRHRLVAYVIPASLRGNGG